MTSPDSDVRELEPPDIPVDEQTVANCGALEDGEEDSDRGD